MFSGDCRQEIKCGFVVTGNLPEGADGLLICFVYACRPCCSEAKYMERVASTLTGTGELTPTANRLGPRSRKRRIPRAINRKKHMINVFNWKGLTDLIP